MIKAEIEGLDSVTVAEFEEFIDKQVKTFQDARQELIDRLTHVVGGKDYPVGLYNEESYKYVYKRLNDLKRYYENMMLRVEIDERHEFYEDIRHTEKRIEILKMIYRENFKEDAEWF